MLTGLLQEIAGSFVGCASMKMHNELERIPNLSSLRHGESARFFDAAVRGYFTWQNEAIFADLEAIKEKRKKQDKNVMILDRLWNGV